MSAKNVKMIAEKIKSIDPNFVPDGRINVDSRATPKESELELMAKIVMAVMGLTDVKHTVSMIYFNRQKSVYSHGARPLYLQGMNDGYCRLYVNVDSSVSVEDCVARIRKGQDYIRKNNGLVNETVTEKPNYVPSPIVRVAPVRTAVPQVKTETVPVRAAVVPKAFDPCEDFVNEPGFTRVNGQDEFGQEYVGFYFDGTTKMLIDGDGGVFAELAKSVEDDADEEMVAVEAALTVEEPVMTETVVDEEPVMTETVVDEETVKTPFADGECVHYNNSHVIHVDDDFRPVGFYTSRSNCARADFVNGFISYHHDENFVMFDETHEDADCFGWSVDEMRLMSMFDSACTAINVKDVYVSACGVNFFEYENGCSIVQFNFVVHNKFAEDELDEDVPEYDYDTINVLKVHYFYNSDGSLFVREKFDPCAAYVDEDGFTREDGVDGDLGIKYVGFYFDKDGSKMMILEDGNAVISWDDFMKILDSKKLTC